MEETSAHSGGTALRAVKRFAQGRKTLMPGRFIRPAQIKSVGSPPGHGRAGLKAHIGEVQASVWDEQTIQACRGAGVILL